MKVMERVFQKLLLSFGNQLTSKWKGLEIHDVYVDWAESMQDFSIGAIDCGLHLAKDLPHPPSQGEFKELCKQYIAPAKIRLEYHLSEEQMERNKVNVQEMLKKLREQLTSEKNR